MNKKFSIAAIVLFLSGFLVFDYVTGREIGDSLNASVYYIFLFILILVGAGLALFFGAFVLFGCILPLGAVVGAIYFIIEGQYFLALVWFMVLCLPFQFFELSQKEREIETIKKYYGCSTARAQEYHKKLTTREIKVLEKENRNW